MASPVDIELGKLPNSDQEPSETTRLNPEGLERYLNIIQISRKTVAKLKGFETFQHIAEMW